MALKSACFPYCLFGTRPGRSSYEASRRQGTSTKFKPPETERELSVSCGHKSSREVGSWLAESSDALPDSWLPSLKRRFRVLFKESLLAVASGISPALTLEAVASEVVNRYRTIVAEFARPHPLRELGSEVLRDAAGATLLASIVLKYGLKALSGIKKYRLFGLSFCSFSWSRSS